MEVIYSGSDKDDDFEDKKSQQAGTGEVWRGWGARKEQGIGRGQKLHVTPVYFTSYTAKWLFFSTHTRVDCGKKKSDCVGEFRRCLVVSLCLVRKKRFPFLAFCEFVLFTHMTLDDKHLGSQDILCAFELFVWKDVGKQVQHPNASTVYRTISRNW